MALSVTSGNSETTSTTVAGVDVTDLTVTSEVGNTTRAFQPSAYDVTVTYLLAMQELRVQVPLGALATVPNGRSLQT